MLRWFERPNAPPPLADVCGIRELGLGASRVVLFGRGRDAFELIVVRDGDGVRGYLNECPHHPLPLNIDARIYTENGRLHCDHHYAVFRFADGSCTAGVCLGQRLEPIPLDIREDRIVIAAGAPRVSL